MSKAIHFNFYTFCFSLISCAHKSYKHIHTYIHILKKDKAIAIDEIADFVKNVNEHRVEF